MPKTKVVTEDIQVILEIAKKIEGARKHADEQVGKARNNILMMWDIAFESEIELRAYQERIDEHIKRYEERLKRIKVARTKGHLKRDIDREV